MRVRDLKIGVGLAAVALAALMVGTALAAVPSTVKFKQAKRNEARFYGKVKSPAGECVIGRKVKIRRSVKGRDPVVTKTFASESGKYVVIIPMQSGGRKLYAQIQGMTAPNGVVCGGDRSPKLKP